MDGFIERCKIKLFSGGDCDIQALWRFIFAAFPAQASYHGFVYNNDTQKCFKRILLVSKDKATGSLKKGESGVLVQRCVSDDEILIK